METFAKLKSIWVKNRKTIIIVVSSVLAVLFIGSILLAIFIGGEFKGEERVSYDVKGKLTIVTGVYQTDYADGTAFEFDKEHSEIEVKVKEPDKEMYTKELFAEEYGFLVNGEGDLYEEASDITMNEDVKFIRVVWIEYRHIKTDIAVNVAGGEQQ